MPPISDEQRRAHLLDDHAVDERIISVIDNLFVFHSVSFHDGDELDLSPLPDPPQAEPVPPVEVRSDPAGRQVATITADARGPVEAERVP